MTELPIPESVWWYVLAGFLLGFILSTLWEWLYFRSRRLRIENRRIAELEARVRSLTPPAGAADSAIPPGAAPPYQGPGVYLESEQSQSAAEAAATTGAASTVRAPFPLHRVPFSAAAQPVDPAQPTTLPPAERDSAAQHKGATVIEQTTIYTVRPAAQTPDVSTSPRQGGAQANSTQVVEQTTTYTVRPPTQAPSAHSSPVQNSPAHSSAATTVEPVGTTAVPGLDPERSTMAAVKPTLEQGPEPEQKPEQKPVETAGVTSARNLAAFAEPAPAAPKAAAALERQPAAAAAAVAATAAPSVEPQQPYTPVQTPAQASPQTPAQAPAPASVPASVYDNRNGSTYRNGFARAVTGTPEIAAPRSTASAGTISQAAPEAAAPGAVTTAPEAQGSKEQDAQKRRIAAAAAAVAAAVRAAFPSAEEAPPDTAPATRDSAPEESITAAQGSTVQGSTAQGATTQGSAAQDSIQQEQAARMAAAAAAAGMAAVLAAKEVQPDAALAAQDSTAQESTTTEDFIEQDSIEQDSTVQEDPAARLAATAAMAALLAAQETQPDTVPAAQDPAAEQSPASAASAASAVSASPSLASILPIAPKETNLDGGSPTKAAEANTQAVSPTGIQPGIQRVSGELDSLLSSLQGLIETTDPLLDGAAAGEEERLVLLTSGASTQPADQEGVTGPYAAKNLSRSEYAVVRLMQSARRFGRELRSLYQGE